MDVSVYAAEAAVEHEHWWFVGRRRLFSRELAQLDMPATSRILDIGTSTGTNLRMLRDLGFTNVVGLDSSEEAIRYCRGKGFMQVEKGDVRALPFPDNSFTLVLATDIIEHIDDDRKALEEIARVLAPGGRVMITVPTFAMLWGLQDEKAHHHRRYRLGPLARSVEATRLVVERRYYFNYVLFLPIWLARRLLLLTRPDIDSEAQINTKWLNRALELVFRFDVASAPVLHPPFGVSALVLARKP